MNSLSVAYNKHFTAWLFRSCEIRTIQLLYWLTLSFYRGISSSHQTQFIYAGSTLEASTEQIRVHARYRDKCCSCHLVSYHFDITVDFIISILHIDCRRLGFPATNHYHCLCVALLCDAGKHGALCIWQALYPAKAVWQENA